jgi:histidine triad (HIT) family protein
MKCIFCEIINGLAPAEILYEDDNVLAFLDINPMNFGHTLVIPKKHFTDLADMPKGLLSDTVSVVQDISLAVKNGLQADAYNLVVNNGEAAGQSVFHFHFHIIPRFHSDVKMKFNLKKYSGSSIKEYAEKIKKEINP